MILRLGLLPINMHAHKNGQHMKLSCTMKVSLYMLILFTLFSYKLNIFNHSSFSEGYECKAMKGSRRLLSNTFVPYIFMEWGKMFSGRYRSTSPCSAASMDHLALDLTKRGYIPYEVRTGFQLNPERCSSKWKIGDMYWRHELANPL